MMPVANHTILILDNSRIFRQGLRVLLENVSDFQVVGDTDGQSALALALECRPSIILTNLWLPRSEDGLALVTRIRHLLPETRVIALPPLSDDPQLVYRAVQAGAVGYVPMTNADVGEVEMAIRTVARGQPYFSSDALTSLLTTIEAKNEIDFGVSQTQIAVLTAREQGVLNLVAHGFTNRQIAERLTITESTVRSHLQNILDKLQLTNRVQAAAFALRNRTTASAFSTTEYSRVAPQSMAADQAEKRLIASSR
jgi:two-component system response regulator NreC